MLLARAPGTQEAPELSVRTPGDDERSPRQEGRSGPQQGVATPNRHALSPDATEPEARSRG
jgi:hypothetical protein